MPRGFFRNPFDFFASKGEEGEGLSDEMRDILDDPEARKWAILGAMKAGLSLALVYIVVFAVVIVIMLIAWNH